MKTCIFGGVDRLESGLAEFKSRFGTTVVPLETAEFYLGGRMRRKLTTALRLLTTDRAALAAIFRVRISRWVVYSVEPVHIQPAVMPDGVVFRKLEEHELRTAPPSWELRQEQIDRFHRLGVNEAYAVFHQGRFAHVSWLLTRSMEGKPPLVNLREDEAEITACVTLPAFRGMGLYPLAIRSLCEIARGQGISRVYMKARPENTPSLRGIEKAGLVRHGSIAHVVLPLVSSDGLVFRGHRLSWPKA